MPTHNLAISSDDSPKFVSILMHYIMPTYTGMQAISVGSCELRGQAFNKPCTSETRFIKETKTLA